MPSTERRYLEVDPSQRPVASTLEERWNYALLHLEGLKKQAGGGDVAGSAGPAE